MSHSSFEPDEPLDDVLVIDDSNSVLDKNPPPRPEAEKRALRERWDRAKKLQELWEQEQGKSRESGQA